MQYSSVNNFDYSSRFSIVANQPFNIDTNGQTVTFGTGLAGTNSSLNKIGAADLPEVLFNPASSPFANKPCESYSAYTEGITEQRS